MRLKDPEAHLVYCTNIHAAHTWAETFEQLRTHLPAVRERVCPDAPMGVGLRLSAEAAVTLRSEHLDDFGGWLRSEGLYLLTINGFVHGAFHRASLKQSVYRPPWGDPARLDYTRDLVAIATALAPEDVEPSISTVPVAFGDPTEQRARDLVQAQLLDCAFDLWNNAERTGRIVRLALEPEPMCMLETIEQTVAFFESTLLDRDATRRFADRTGLDDGGAETILRRHLGVCLDTCHAAVEFEDPRECIDAVLGAGLTIPKIQVTTGLELDPRTPRALEALSAFAEDVYLHQVVIEHDDRLHRLLDLPEALALKDDPRSLGRRWRVHFHIPVFSDKVPPFSNTQSFLRECLQHARRRGASEHLEVETYTWDVLPPSLRTHSVDDAIAREIRWVGKEWSA